MSSSPPRCNKEEEEEEEEEQEQEQEEQGQDSKKCQETMKITKYK